MPSSVADAHADAAQVTSDAAESHVVSATIANQEAAQRTADAARLAKTEADRRAVAESATRVIAREQQIVEAFANLGIGQCGARTYAHVTPKFRDALISKLHAEGMTVTGVNPWNIDTNQADVKLRAAWNPRTQELKLIVTSSAFYAPCDVIWERIEPKLRSIIGP